MSVMSLSPKFNTINMGLETPLPKPRATKDFTTGKNPLFQTTPAGQIVSALGGKSADTGATGAKPAGMMTGGQIPQMTPEQMQLFQQMFQHVGPESYLSKLAQGNEGLFQQIEAPAMREFSSLAGNMASRFAGAGGAGTRRTSGFQNAMGAEASSLSERLAANRQSLQQQAIKDLMSMSGDLLQQRPYMNVPGMEGMENEPWWSKLAGIGLPIIGGVTGGYFGGPMGAIGGANVGHNIAQGLRGRQTTSPDWEGISKMPRSWDEFLNKNKSAQTQAAEKR
jgi:hypothetical protein